jgi:hypothetical protein
VLKGLIYELLRFLRGGVQPKQHFVTLQVLQILITFTGDDEALAATRTELRRRSLILEDYVAMKEGYVSNIFQKH